MRREVTLRLMVEFDPQDLQQAVLGSVSVVESDGSTNVDATAAVALDDVHQTLAVYMVTRMNATLPAALPDLTPVGTFMPGGVRDLDPGDH